MGARTYRMADAAPRLPAAKAPDRARLQELQAVRPGRDGMIWDSRDGRSCATRATGVDLPWLAAPCQRLEAASTGGCQRRIVASMVSCGVNRPFLDLGPSSMGCSGTR